MVLIKLYWWPDRYSVSRKRHLAKNVDIIFSSKLLPHIRHITFCVLVLCPCIFRNNKVVTKQKNALRPFINKIRNYCVSNLIATAFDADVELRFSYVTAFLIFNSFITTNIFFIFFLLRYFRNQHIILFFAKVLSNLLFNLSTKSDSTKCSSYKL